MNEQLVAQAKQVKGAHVESLLGKSNVVGVGLGYKISRGVNTGELALVVSVARKVASDVLSAKDMVPRSLDSVKTDVVETGVLRAFDLGPRDRWRPVVPPGVTIGHYRITAGTFGCLVRRGEERFILSNNHVLADINAGEEGDAILQPGPSDGGTADDRVATLADYVPIDFGTAPAECPIAGFSADLLNVIAGAFGSSHRLKRQSRPMGKIGWMRHWPGRSHKTW